jgi:hypothetical protein
LAAAHLEWLERPTAARRHVPHAPAAFASGSPLSPPEALEKERIKKKKDADGLVAVSAFAFQRKRV